MCSKTLKFLLFALCSINFFQASLLIAKAPLPCSCRQKLGFVKSACGNGFVKCPYYIKNLRAEPMDGNLSELYTPYYVRTGISRYASWNNY